MSVSLMTHHLRQFSSQYHHCSYVDDILVLSPYKSACNQIFDGLTNFKVQNKGPPKTFLSLNIICDFNKTIVSNQSDYINCMLIRFNMTNAKLASTSRDRSQSS